jgi:hypothetical protein
MVQIIINPVYKCKTTTITYISINVIHVGETDSVTMGGAILNGSVAADVLDELRWIDLSEPGLPATTLEMTSAHLTDTNQPTTLQP